MSVVQVVGSGMTRDNSLALCIKIIWLLSAYCNTELDFKHILGKKDIIADVLSHIYSDKPVDQGTSQCLDHLIWDVVPLQAFNLDLYIKF